MLFQNVIRSAVRVNIHTIRTHAAKRRHATQAFEWNTREWSRLVRFQGTDGGIYFGEVGKVNTDGTIASAKLLSATGSPSSKEVPVSKLLSPLTPTAILCIGLNYQKHAAESNLPAPANPVVFSKYLASVQDPFGPIVIPKICREPPEVDYECELAVVIGKRAKNVPAAKALEYVLGYTCANDVSSRLWQLQRGGSQWSFSKGFDTFCPLGPMLVSTSVIPNPNKLKIRSILNGKVVQDSNTADMIFHVPQIIEFLSQSTTLLPGTVILTGTPEGVGMARKPPLWLKPGDKITIDIEQIGQLTNHVVADQ